MKLGIALVLKGNVSALIVTIKAKAGIVQAGVAKLTALRPSTKPGKFTSVFTSVTPNVPGLIARALVIVTILATVFDGNSVIGASVTVTIFFARLSLNFSYG